MPYFFRKKLLKLMIAGLIMQSMPAFAGDFPAWMDEVEFKSGQKELATPQAPLDPETGQAANFESRKGSYRPKLPDFSKLREKAIKATSEKKASDTASLSNTISFSEENRQKLEKSRTDLEDLLKTITDPGEKERLTSEKMALDRRIEAASQLLQLIGNQKNDIAAAVSQLSEEDFAKALELQKLIFGRPSEQKKPAGARPVKTDPARQFYRPTSKFKSFYTESKEKAAEELDNQDED